MGGILKEEELLNEIQYLPHQTVQKYFKPGSINIATFKSHVLAIIETSYAEWLITCT